MKYENISKEIKPYLDDWAIEYFDHIKRFEKLKISKYCKIKDIYERMNLIEKDGYTKSDESLTGYTKEVLKDKISKRIESSLLKIDVAVHKKLKNLDILEISNISINHGYDGSIEGSWKIKDASNTYIFSFETIITGGYNIQFAHFRTKYNLKLL